MEPKFSLKELDVIAMAQQGLSVSEIAQHTQRTANQVSASLSTIYVKLGLKSRMMQLREYQFGAPVAKAQTPEPKHVVHRSIDNKELIVKIRHRDGDGCFFCGNTIDFAPESKFLEHGPSMHIIKDGIARGQLIPDDHRKLAHRSCNPQVKVKDNKRSRLESHSRYRQRRREKIQALNIDTVFEARVQ